MDQQQVIYVSAQPPPQQQQQQQQYYYSAQPPPQQQQQQFSPGFSGPPQTSRSTQDFSSSTTTTVVVNQPAPQVTHHGSYKSVGRDYTPLIIFLVGLVLFLFLGVIPGVLVWSIGGCYLLIKGDAAAKCCACSMLIVGILCGIVCVLVVAASVAAALYYQFAVNSVAQ